MPNGSSSPPSLSLDQINQRIQFVLPKPAEEQWKRAIPWRVNLMAARDEAQKANKPVFLWIMVGNPQGCT